MYIEKRNKHYRFFMAAYAVALASPGVGGKDKNRFRLGAVIVDKQRHIVSARFNILKTHPQLSKYYTWPYLHAEAYAILSLGLYNCVDTDIYVVRILRNNSLALSKPCDGCMKLIKDVGIKNIYYSTENGYNHESW